MLRNDIGLPIVSYMDGIQLSSAQSNKVLSEFFKFQRSKKIKVWDEGATYFGVIRHKDGKRRKIKIEFPRKIVYRSKRIITTNKKYARYDIVGDKIGSGMFGSVHDVLATLSHLSNGLMKVKVDQEYVIKVQDHTQRDTDGSLKNEPSDAANEERIGRHIPHLGTKQITYRRNVKGEIIESYLVSNKLKHQTLLDIIVKDYNGEPCLSTNERLKLSIALLRDYVVQMYDHRVMHCDIKSDNVMVEDGYEWTKYFDVELSQLFDEIDSVNGGTLLYSAPEVFSQHTTRDEKSDFYSLGIMLLHLWRSVDAMDQISIDALTQYAQAGKSREFTKIGQGIHGIDDLLPLIDVAIKNLMAFNKDERLHPLKVLNKLESIYLQYKLKSKDEFAQFAICKANAIARETNDKLRDIKLEMTENPLLALQIKINYAVENLKSIQEMETKMQENSEAIAVMEFIDVINVRAFKKIVEAEKFSADDIKVKAQQIITSFVNNTNLVLQMHDEMLVYFQLLDLAHSDDEINLLLDDLYETIDVMLYKIKKSEITFDDLEILNKKCDKKLPILRDFITKFKQQIAQQEKYQWLNTYTKLYFKLKSLPDDNPSIQFRNKVVNTIKEYVDKILIPQDINGKKTEECNQKCRDDVNVIVKILDTELSDKKIMIERLNTVSAGLFSNQLQKNLRQVLISEQRLRY